MKLEERLVNLKEEQQEILNQLGWLDNVNDFIILMKARERLVGAINLAELAIKEKEEQDANK